MSLIFACIISAIMVGADQLSKALVISHFKEYPQPVTVIKGLLSFSYTENNGAGFSILSGKTLFLIIFTLAAMGVIIYLLAKGTFRHQLTNWGFCLVLSGGIGNFLDRTLRGGFVVDFIRTDFMNFPIFNVADICVTVGAALIIIYFIKDFKREVKEKKQNKRL